MTRAGLVLAPASALLLAACADDPVYLAPAPTAVEINLDDMMEGGGIATVVVPVRLETADEAEDRAALAMRLGLTADQVPTVRRDMLDLALEWTVKNLDDAPAVAALAVTGANEFFSYDPQAFVIDPDEDEPPPPLLGGEPIQVEPLGVTSGVLREDEFHEAEQDLDAITRAGLNPETALLTLWRTPDVTDPATMDVLMPAEAIPAFLKLDVTFTGDTHLVLEYVVRVRDHSGRLRPTEMDPGLLVPPATTTYAPPPEEDP